MSAYIQFGAGKVYVNPNAGNLAVNPTPMKALTIQDMTIDISGDIKELRGQNKFPDDQTAGDMKCTGKFSVGRKDLTMFNQIMFADTIAAGGVSVQPDEVHTVTAAAATVTPPGSGTFANDLGVIYQATGIALVRVASAPTVGQYSVSAGVYTFNATDNTHVVTISYSYTLASAGAIYQINNQLLGYGPVCELYLVDAYQPVSNVLNVIRVYAARFTKIALGNKRDDYAKPEMEFAFFAAPSGRVIDMYSAAG